MSFGVMGGHMRPQGHVQMMVRIFDYGQNPQAASDGPRWYVDEDMGLKLEPGFAPGVVETLRARGHTLIRRTLAQDSSAVRNSSTVWSVVTAPAPTGARMDRLSVSSRRSVSVEFAIWRYSD